MKRVLLLVMMGFALSFLPGCDLNDDDNYSLDNAWIGFGLIQKNEGTDNMTILMDDGEVLYPLNYSSGELKNNDRVLTNFTILGNRNNDNHDEEYFVRINSLRKILYKGILEITPAIEDSIGNDPIEVKDCWIKRNLLNVELKYYGGETVHFINLVKQPETVPSSSTPIVLEIRHNKNGDRQSYPLTAIVTFDLSSLKVDGATSVPFKIVAKESDNKQFEYSGEYEY